VPYPFRSFRDWVAEEEKLGHVLRIKVPIKCGDYNHIVDIGNNVPGKIPETEIRATVRYLHTLPGKPIGIIENPVNNRPDIPVLVNPWPSRERALRGLGCTKSEFCRKLETVEKERIPPRVVTGKRAPCKEVVIPKKRIDLRRDIPRCWVEFNQVLWSTCNGTIVVRDPHTGNHDLGKVRLGQYEWKNADPSQPFSLKQRKSYMFGTLIYAGQMSSNAGRYYMKEYRSRGKPMPAAIVFGVPTDVHIVASMRSFRWPEGGDEYGLVGAFRGEPMEVTPSETIPGLMVPASAEWVIEGEFLPEDEKMPPYAEDIASGYMFGDELCPVFKVNCITHRQDPIWDATTFSSSGSSAASGGYGSHEGPHTGLQFLNCEGAAIKHLRGLGFKVKDVVMIGGGREVVVVQLEVDGADKPAPHYGKRVLMALHGNPAVSIGPVTKYLICVGPDINPYDFSDVMWALGTRSMPVSDSVTIEKGMSGWGDPGGLPGPLGWKSYGEQIMIDATVKVPERYASFPPRAEPLEWEEQAIRRIGERIIGQGKRQEG
jgi:3-polyprenyl-4-hydroxybenzoate decarboxylase